MAHRRTIKLPVYVFHSGCQLFEVWRTFESQFRKSLLKHPTRIITYFWRSDVKEVEVVVDSCHGTWQIRCLEKFTAILPSTEACITHRWSLRAELIGVVSSGFGVKIRTTVGVGMIRYLR